MNEALHKTLGGNLWVVFGSQKNPSAVALDWTGGGREIETIITPLRWIYLHTHTHTHGLGSRSLCFVVLHLLFGYPSGRFNREHRGDLRDGCKFIRLHDVSGRNAVCGKMKNARSR